MNFDELRKKIKEISSDASVEPGSNDYDDMMETLGKLRNHLENLETLEEENRESIEHTGLDDDGFRIMERISEKVEELTDDQRGYGGLQTLDNFTELLQEKPYHLPSLYESSSINETFLLRDGNKTNPENVSKLFWTMFPGKTFMDYGKEMKVKCGTFQNFTINLQDNTLGHILSEDPIFEDDGQPVHRVIELNSGPVSHRPFYKQRGIPKYNILCKNCLTFPDELAQGGQWLKDETMNCTCPINDPAYGGEKQWKFQAYQYTRPQIISNVRTKIISNLDDVVVAGSEIELESPFDQLFSVEKLEDIEIGKYLTGFTRSSKKLGIRREITYNPFIGYKLRTKGLLFRLSEFDTAYTDKIFANNILIRDALICILRERLANGLRQQNRNRKEIDIFFSSCISSLELDRFDNNTFDLQIICTRLNDSNGDWITQAITNVKSQLSTWSSRTPNLDDDVIKDIIRTIQNNNIDESTVREKIIRILIRSIASLIYITSGITAGLTNQEMNFDIDYEQRHIIIYDDETGGNGATDLVYNNLRAPSEQYIFTQKKNISKPRYFDEIFLERFLPCEQGVAERCFYQNLESVISNNKIITGKIQRLENLRRDLEQKTRDELDDRTIMNFFPLNSSMINEVGDDISRAREELSIEEQSRLQLSSQICIHGCPDCLMLGRIGEGDPIDEPYSISKYYLDLLFSHYTENFTVSNFDKDEIERILTDRGFVILSKDLDNNNREFDDVDLVVNRYLGRKVAGKLCKISGFWCNCEINDTPRMTFSWLISLMQPYEVEPKDAN